MDQQHVGVTVFAQLQRLARAHGDHVHINARLTLKVGQDFIKQP